MKAEFYHEMCNIFINNTRISKVLKQMNNQADYEVYNYIIRVASDNKAVKKYFEEHKVPEMSRTDKEIIETLGRRKIICPFDVEDTVFFMNNNHIREGYVASIQKSHIQSYSSIHVFMKNFSLDESENKTLRFDEAFHTEEELIKSLTKKSKG